MTTNSSAVEARSGAARILVGRLCARDGRGRSVRSELAAEAAPRAPFPLAAVGQEAPQAMARRMSTRAGTRSGEQLMSEDAFEATAGEKAEDAAEPQESARSRRRATGVSEESARSTEAQAPRQSGISLEKETRSLDPRGVATASGGASILCSWLVAREAFAGLSVARRSPPARGRERLTKDVGLEMLDRRAATAETRKASVKAIGKGERLWGVLERQRPGSPTSRFKSSGKEVNDA